MPKHLFYASLQVLKNIKIGIFISLVNILIQGVNLLFHNIIARNLGFVNFGNFGILLNDYTIFCAIADFGMLALILAYFGKRATEGSLFTHILQLRILMSATTAALMIGFSLLFRRNHDILFGELILVLGLFFQHSFFDWYFISGKFWKKLLISKVLHTISLALTMEICLCLFNFNTIHSIAFAMVVSAVPTFSFGISQAFSIKTLKLGRHFWLFSRLMIKSAFPYALTNIASYAYLPVGLYAVSIVASPAFLGAYTFAHRITLLASSLMVYFIYSSVLTLHQSDSSKIRILDQGIFTLFVTIALIPFWAAPNWVLKIIFFAAPWTEDSLLTSAYCLRILSFSLVFQAIRLGMISTLLKEKRTLTYGFFITAGGVLNIASCVVGVKVFTPDKIPILTLSGDLFLTFFLICYFIKNRRIGW